MGESCKVVLPSGKSDKALAQSFNDCFANKIEKIRSDIISQHEGITEYDFNDLEQPFGEKELLQFSPIMEDDIS
jgi:hypothetical protein